MKIVPIVDEKAPLKKLTKAQQKAADKKREAEIKAQAKAQAEAMDKQVKAMGKAVKNAICNTCVHCENPNKDFDRFKVTSSKGSELYCPMNFCKLAGLSLVDVKTCEKYEEVKG